MGTLHFMQNKRMQPDVLDSDTMKVFINNALGAGNQSLEQILKACFNVLDYESKMVIITHMGRLVVNMNKNPNNLLI